MATPPDLLKEDAVAGQTAQEIEPAMLLQQFLVENNFSSLFVVF